MEEKVKYISLSDYCSSVRDGTHDTPKPTETGKYLVTSRAVNKNTIDFASCYYISQEDFDKINKRSLVEQWDVIMTMIGSVGRLLLVKDSPDYAIKNMALFKIGDEMKAKWLYYYLSNKSVQDYFEQIANGTSQHFIGLGQLRKLKIADFTPKSARIASILSSYDNLIELNTRRIKLLEQMAENLYKEWFVRFRFPNYQSTPIENGIPKGWKVEKLGNVSNISTGKCNREDAEEDGIYPLFDRSQEIKKSSEWLKDCEAIIVPGEGTSFIPRYYWGKFNLHQRCYCVEPQLENIGKFLFYTLMLNRKYFLSVATGATVPSLRYNNFAKMKFILPSEDIYRQFDSIVTPIFSEIAALQSHSANLTRQRDLLLPRLMSGQLPLSHL